jgi:RNA polymerase primary sigma factor
MEFKLVPRVVDELTSSLHKTIDQIRRYERQIMNLVVTQSHMPRKTFLDSFPKNETNLTGSPMPRRPGASTPSSWRWSPTT